MAKMNKGACIDLGMWRLRGLGSVSPFCSKDMMAKMTEDAFTDIEVSWLEGLVSPFSSKDMIAQMAEDVFADLGMTWLRGLGSVSPFCSKDMKERWTTKDASTDLGVSWIRGLGSVSPFCSKDMMAKMTRRHSARSSSVIDSCTESHCCMTK